MTAMMISLPEETLAFLEEQMLQEGYESPSDYLRDLILEAQKRRARRELDAKLLEGLQSPATELTQADWTELREKIYARSPELRGK
jgi:antitoxin ParD1/3/4